MPHRVIMVNRLNHLYFQRARDRSNPQTSSPAQQQKPARSAQQAKRSVWEFPSSPSGPAFTDKPNALQYGETILEEALNRNFGRNRIASFEFFKKPGRTKRRPERTLRSERS